MCADNPFCSIPPPIGLINMAANHVEMQHGITITSEARQLLSDRIAAAAQPNLDNYLASQGMSHVDLLQLAEKQFVQGLPNVQAGAAQPGAAPPHIMDGAAVLAGIAHKAWSPLWQ
jgi:hypothetical protein